MVNLRVYVEGPGEKGFVDTVLAPHLSSFAVYAVAAFTGHPKRKPSGGIRRWAGDKGTRVELKRALLHQPSPRYPLFVTTMVDYYALPRDWPGRDTASSLPAAQRSPRIESGMFEDMREALGDSLRINRFIPYVCLHELEALILAQPDALLAEFPGCSIAIEALKADIARQYPEDVDDGASTAPSKRIVHFLPEYAMRKGMAATNALRQIDLNHLRQACPHFGRWLCCLESLGTCPKGN